MKRAFLPVLAGLLVGVVIVSSWCCQRNRAAGGVISTLVQDYMFRSSSNPLLCSAAACQYHLRFDQAIALYRQALLLAPDGAETAYITNQLAHIYLLLDQDSTAKVWINKFDINYRHPFPSLPAGALADYYYNKGVAYSHAFQSDSAFHYLYPALEYYQKAYVGGQHLHIAQCLNTLGLLHYEYGDVADSAKLYISTAAGLFQSGGLERYAWESHYARACLCLPHRSHGEGVTYIDQAIRTSDMMRPQNALFNARCLSMKGNLLKKLKRYPEADRYFQTAIDSTAGVRSPLRQFFFRDMIINDAFLEDTARFLQDFRHLNEFLGTQPEVHVHPVRLLGYYFFKRKQWRKSIECYEAFLKDMRGVKRPNQLLIDEAIFVLSTSYMKLDEYDKALEYACRNLFIERYTDPIPPWSTLISPDFHENKPQRLVAYSKIVGVLLGRFAKQSNNSDLVRADQLCTMLDTLLFSSITAQNSNDDAVLNYQDEVGAALFPQAVQTAYLCFQHTGDSLFLDKAFRYCERMKSYLLYRSLLRDRPGAASWGDSLRYLRARIDQLSFQQDKLGNLSPQQSKELEDATRRANEKQQQQQKEQDALQQTVGGIPGFRNIRKDLLNGQAMVQYIIGRGQIYIFYLDKTSVVFQPVDFPPSRDSLVQEYLSLLKRLKRSDRTRYISVATELYQLLIGPFATQLAHNQELVVIPDRQLGSIPFEALLEPKVLAPADSSFEQLPYLLHKVQITYSSAWKIWHNHANRNRQKPTRKIRAAAWIDTSIPQWEQERDLLKRIFKENNAVLDIFIDRQCSKAHFLGHQVTYDILHLFMHAKSNPKERRDNSIFFSKQKGDTLYGFELEKYDMLARLATLFACETASGNTTSAEGSFSLTRNFLSRGIPSAVSTLWKVDAQITASLTYGFYDPYLKHFDAGKALQEAKINYLENTDKFLSHPGYWAGFVCIQ
jgi:CHAT domain-containing protein